MLHLLELPWLFSVAVQVPPTVDPLLAWLAVPVLGAIGFLMRELLKAKDAHITELRETIKYQRSVIDHGLSTAGRAVELAEKGAA